MRHVGRMVNTDQKLIIVMMQIPKREDHALTVPVDGLSQRYEQAVRDILESPEGQAAETLADVLHRRVMPDSGKNVLQALHEGGMLHAVPIDKIMMYPKPNMPFPLTQILEGMGRRITKSEDPLAILDTGPVMQPDNATHRYNQILVNQKIEGLEQRRAVAQNLLIEAKMLDNAAAEKRNRAYEMAPELRIDVVQPTLSQVPVVKKKAAPKKKSLDGGLVDTSDKTATA